MDVLEMLGQESIERTADDLDLLVTKDLLGTLIEEYDALIGINGDDRILGDCDNAFKSGLCSTRLFLGAAAFNGDDGDVRCPLDQLEIAVAGSCSG